MIAADSICKPKNTFLVSIDWRSGLQCSGMRRQARVVIKHVKPFDDADRRSVAGAIN
jgi:hypothetical protein